MAEKIETLDRYNPKRYTMDRSLLSMLDDKIAENVKDAVDSALENPNGVILRVAAKQEMKLNDINRTLLQVRDDTQWMRKTMESMNKTLKRVDGGGAGGGLFNAALGALGAAGLAGGLWKGGKAALRGIKSFASLLRSGSSKLATKAVSTVGVKTASKATASGIKATIKKSIAKLAAKHGLKSIVKKIPFGLALIPAAIFAAGRAMAGDYKGAMAEVGSGAAAIVPGGGTVASLVADVGILARDVYKDVYEVYPEEDPMAGTRMEEIKTEVFNYLDSQPKEKQAKQSEAPVITPTKGVTAANMYSATPTMKHTAVPSVAMSGSIARAGLGEVASSVKQSLFGQSLGSIGGGGGVSSTSGGGSGYSTGGSMDTYNPTDSKDPGIKYGTTTIMPQAGSLRPDLQPGQGTPNEGEHSVSGGDSAAIAMQYFMNQGWTKEQAAGIVGNLMTESINFSPDVISGKTKGDGGKAIGIGQWHPDRQALFEKKFGKSLIGSTLQEQLEFVQWELENTEKKAGDILKKVKTAEEAALVVDQHYERSAGLHRRERAQNASKLMEREVTRREKTKEVIVGEGGFVEQKQAGKIRSKPIPENLNNTLQYAANESGLEVVVTSGAQMSIEEAKAKGARQVGKRWVLPNGEVVRTGSTRHDENIGAADLKLRDPKTGKYLNMADPKDRERAKVFVKNAVKGGATGIGFGSGYMGDQTLHVGYGDKNSWGGDTAWIEQARSEAYKEGLIDANQWAKANQEKAKQVAQVSSMDALPDKHPLKVKKRTPPPSELELSKTTPETPGQMAGNQGGGNQGAITPSNPQPESKPPPAPQKSAMIPVNGGTHPRMSNSMAAALPNRGLSRQSTGGNIAPTGAYGVTDLAGDQTFA